MDALALTSRQGYGLPVTVNPVADLGRSNNQGAQAPKTSLLALFLCSQCRSMVTAVRGTPSGVPVSLIPVGQPAYSCHLPSLGRERWQLHYQGASPMRTRNPFARAAALRAIALAALRADSSLSVRLARYNAAMAKVRALEAQGVDHAAS